MKFTIGIPAYNQADTLPESIESALAQTTESEVIVVIDGSPDNSEEIARAYPVKVITQVNKGLASARNTVIMNMTGDYFLPLDSDDILLDNCVEEMIQVINLTGADIIAPSLRTFGLSEQDIIVHPSPELKDFQAGNRIPYCSAIKKEALLECGGYQPRMAKGFEDLHLWYDLMLRGKKIVGIQEPLVRYRTKKESMWRDAEKNKKELWEQIVKDFPIVASHSKA